MHDREIQESSEGTVVFWGPPAEALPKLLRLLMLVREEFLTHETLDVLQEAYEPTNHARMR